MKETKCPPTIKTMTVAEALVKLSELIEDTHTRYAYSLNEDLKQIYDVLKDCK